MADELSELNLGEDFKKASVVPDARRWQLVKAGPLEVWATMSSERAPAESFQAQLLWESYPGEPPFLKVRDPATGRLDLPSAWPKVRGFRPQSLDACVNWCQEGFKLHPEWRADVRFHWEAHGNVLLKILRILQGELDDFFDGRYP